MGFERFDNYEASPEKPVQRYKPPPAPPKNWEPRQCKFCDQVFEANEGGVKDRRQNQMGKLRRHVLMHFKDKLNALLPKQRPWECPMPNCDHVAKAQIDLTSHYAFTHDQISDYCSKDDILGIPVAGGMGGSSSPKGGEYGIKFQGDRAKSVYREDYNNNTGERLMEEIQRRQALMRQQQMQASMLGSGKSEEEKRFDFALASAVSKVSFWFTNGNVDSAELSKGIAKLGSTKYRGKKGPYDRFEKPNSDEEFYGGKTIPDLSKAIGDRLNAKANAQMMMKEKLDREEEELNVSPDHTSKQRAEFFRGRTEEVQEQSRSILNSIIGASAPLAPPRKTFSMDPFGQKSNANRAPPAMSPAMSQRKPGSLLQQYHNPSPAPQRPTQSPQSSNPAYNPAPNKQRGAYVDPFDQDDDTPNRGRNPNQSREYLSQQGQRLDIRNAPERDGYGNYSCKNCGFSSKLRMQVLKHNCDGDSE